MIIEACQKKLILFLLLILILNVSACTSINSLDVKGFTNYHKSKIEKISTSIFIDYKLKIDPLCSKKIQVFVAGTINPEYDHFLNEVKTNTFTGINLEF